MTSLLNSTGTPQYPCNSSQESDIADMFGRMQDTKPLFRYDAGWLYMVAGLAICAVAILVSVRQDLRELQGQLSEIQTKEYLVIQQLQASSLLLDQLDANDEALLRRLAASQLNLVPADRRPLMRSINHSQSVIDWMNATIRYEKVALIEPSVTLLEKMTAGTGRLWMFGIGILCVFIGLLLDPTLGRLHALRLSRWGSPKPDSVSVALEMARAAGPLTNNQSKPEYSFEEDEQISTLELAIARESNASIGAVQEHDLEMVLPSEIAATQSEDALPPLVPTMEDKEEPEEEAQTEHVVLTDQDEETESIDSAFFGEGAGAITDDSEESDEDIDEDVALLDEAEGCVEVADEDEEPESLTQEGEVEVVEDVEDEIEAEVEEIEDEVAEAEDELEDDEDEYEDEGVVENAQDEEESEDEEALECEMKEESDPVQTDEVAEETSDANAAEKEEGAEDDEEEVEWEYVDVEEDEEEEDGEYEYEYVYVDEDGNEIKEDKVNEAE